MACLHSDNNNTLRISTTSIYASSYSHSTSSLEDFPLSPRSLYAETFERPYSCSGATAQRRIQPRHKNIRDLIGMTTGDEFDALPIAVRRKYFSTLERLRFAQNPKSFTINDRTGPIRRRRSITERRGVRPSVLNDSSPPRARLRKASRQSSVSSADVSWFLTLPDKIREKQFSKEEQLLLTGQYRDTVILDAADEAIYKASRRASRKLTPLTKATTPPFSRDNSMDSARGSTKESQSNSIRKAMYDSFRWMDEETDLDLRLTLDDYHANLDGVVIPTPGSTQRPSFRRHMSISKIPFGRSSISSSMSQPAPAQPAHTRQKSRTMSLIHPKHTNSVSLSSIDPHATHYQDPEARLKLRVYLASPQKFDEAIEFGFPSLEGVSDTADKENRRPRKAARGFSGYRGPLADDTKTFLNDDNVSLSSSDASMLDPDSPLTPSEVDGTFRTQAAFRPPFSKASRPSDDFSHLGIRRPVLHKQAESYSQSIAGSREMTLRMTLTRSDLRADESLMGSWQGSQRTKSPPGEVPPAGHAIGSEKLEVKGPFGGVDGWGPADKENGVVRRLWNRVRSGPKKTLSLSSWAAT